MEHDQVAYARQVEAFKKKYDHLEGAASLGLRLAKVKVKWYHEASDMLGSFYNAISASDPKEVASYRYNVSPGEFLAELKNNVLPRLEEEAKKVIKTLNGGAGPLEREDQQIVDGYGALKELVKGFETDYTPMTSAVNAAYWAKAEADKQKAQTADDGLTQALDSRLGTRMPDTKSAADGVSGTWRDKAPAAASSEVGRRVSAPNSPSR